MAGGGCSWARCTPGFASATATLCTRPAAMHSSSPVPATQLCAMQALSQRPSGPARALGRPAAGLRRPARPVGTLARAQRSSTEETPWEGAGAWRSLLGAAALSVILLKVGDSALARRPSELAAPWHSPPHHNSLASRCSALATGACRRRRCIRAVAATRTKPTPATRAQVLGRCALHYTHLGLLSIYAGAGAPGARRRRRVARRRLRPADCPGCRRRWRCRTRHHPLPCQGDGPEAGCGSTCVAEFRGRRYMRLPHGLEWPTLVLPCPLHAPLTASQPTPHPPVCSPAAAASSAQQWRNSPWL